MVAPHIRWAIDILTNSGYQLYSTIPDIMQNNPWSTVYRFKTNKGFVFLKKVPPALSIEPTIINILYNEFHAPVPLLIAENQQQNCFLMQDGGIPLHQNFLNNFQDILFVNMAQEYVSLQIRLTDYIERFLDLDVPDWRLEKLPTLYQELIAQKKILLEDGLTQDDLLVLKKLLPKFVTICEQLSRYKIKDTFSHADFHDKNILINSITQKTTIIDLGEVVITHPFFSLHNCLHMAKENFLLSDSQYQQLQLDCLYPWLAFESKQHVIEILSLIQQCWSIHAVLAEFRLLNSIHQADLQKLQRQGRLAKKLRYWINQ